MDLKEDSFDLQDLRRVCESKEFANKPVMQKLLTYLVTEFLEGRSGRIKGLTIAIDVFDKGSDFDADRNPLVRNAATRLRKMLRTYYLDEGSCDPFRIEIPQGKYIPDINRRNEGEIQQSSRGVSELPRITVLPFLNLTGTKDFDYIALGFSLQLSDALMKFDDFRVIGMNKRLDDDGTSLSSIQRKKGICFDFCVDGDIQLSGNYARISLRLIDQSDQSTVWTETFDFNGAEERPFQHQDAIIQEIASKIGSEHGHINQRRYQVLLQSKPRSLREQDLILRYYHHNTVLTEDSAVEFQQAVFEALEKEPESALLNSFAGDIYGQIYSMDFPGAEEALEKFDHYIEKAYSINPNHQLIIGSLAFKCLIHNDRDRFINLLDKSKNWATVSPFRLGGLALCTCLFGEWDEGKKMLDQIFDSNFFIPGWLYGLVSLYHYRRSEYRQALEASNKYQIPGLHWKYIHRIVALAQLGDIEEARKEFQALLMSRPDFVERGRYLMSILIKEPSLLEHLVEGFAKLGVRLA